MSAPDLKSLCYDLEAEQADLDAVVTDLRERQWLASTPAPGWSIRDQIGHLAFFEDKGVLALQEPDAFRIERKAASADTAAYEGKSLQIIRSMSGVEVLRWWRTSRAILLQHLRKIRPNDRVPWYGPDMSVISFATARLMEAWAHGQDIADALALTRESTHRLRHIAHLGVATRTFSFVNRDLQAPQRPVFVDLEAPDGSRWRWGEEGQDVVRGPAVDFCLVVTQRRHLEDTRLEVLGDEARTWLLIAQAFAGPPGKGRPPAASRTSGATRSLEDDA